MDDLRHQFELSEKYRRMAKARIDEVLSNVGIARRDDVVLIGGFVVFVHVCDGLVSDVPNFRISRRMAPRNLSDLRKSNLKKTKIFQDIYKK